MYSDTATEKQKLIIVYKKVKKKVAAAQRKKSLEFQVKFCGTNGSIVHRVNSCHETIDKRKVTRKWQFSPNWRYQQVWYVKAWGV